MKNVDKLAAGSYTGRVTVTPANGTAAMVPVTLVVEAAPPKPQLSVGPAILTLNVEQSSGSLLNQFVVSNTGSGQLSFEASAGCSWVTLGSDSGTVAAGKSQVIPLTINPAGFSESTYYCDVTARDTASGTEQKVLVTLQVHPQPSILLSQSGLLFTAVQGVANPLPQTLGVVNAGSGTLNWQASAADCAWADVTATGTSVAGTTVGQLTVTPKTRGLAVGTTYCTIRVTAAGAANSPQLVMVRFKVVPAGQTLPAQVYPAGMILAAQNGGSDPAPVTIALDNLHGPALTYTTIGTTEVKLASGGDWFTQSPASGALKAGGSDSITVQGKIAQLPPGVYRGSLGIGFSDGNTHTVEVLAVVAGAASTPASASTKSRYKSAEQPLCRPAAGVPELTLGFESLEHNFTVTSPGPLTVRVMAKNGCGYPVNDGPVWVNFSTPDSRPADPRLDLEWVRDGTWEGTWTPSTLGRIRMRAEGSSQTRINTLQGRSELVYGTVLAASSEAEALVKGVGNAAAVKPVNQVARGSWISIYGDRLASGLALAGAPPLPTELRQTTVRFGEFQLPLAYVTPGQVNALIPLSSVETNTRLPLLVQRGETQATPLPMTVVDVQPAIFAQNKQGYGQGAIQDAAYNLVDKDHPAKAGDVIVIYATGLGAVDNPPAEEGGRRLWPRWRERWTRRWWNLVMTPSGWQRRRCTTPAWRRVGRGSTR